MSAQSRYSTLFEAFSEAQAAYVRLCAKGRGRPDQELARDADYQRFHRSGMTLALTGGGHAVRAAMQQLSKLNAEREPAAEEAELARMWAGLDAWDAGNSEPLRDL